MNFTSHIPQINPVYRWPTYWLMKRLKLSNNKVGPVTVSALNANLWWRWWIVEDSRYMVTVMSDWTI